MSTSAHPAFPSLPPPSSSSSAIQPPTAPAQLLALLQSSPPPQAVVPVLYRIAAGEGQRGRGELEKARNGEEVLCLDGADVLGGNWGRDGGGGGGGGGPGTAGLVFVLSARLSRGPSRSDKANAELLDAAIKLCQTGETQVLNMCMQRVSTLAWGMVRLAAHLGVLETILEPLGFAIRKTYHPTVIAGAHAAFLEACLLSRRFDAGVLVASATLTDARAAGPTYLDVLTFHHHAGLISAKAGNWARAKQMFATAVSLPTASPSAIQVSCAKRAILCELSHTGKVIKFPSYTSQTVSRTVDRAAAEYLKLAKAFEAHEWGTVKTVAGDAVFAEDFNAGLLEIVLASTTKRRILRVAESYSRMTLHDLVSRVGKGDAGQAGVEEVVRVLQDMVAQRVIVATLSQSEPQTITFSDEPREMGLAELEEVQDMAKWLAGELRHGDKNLGISTKYLRKQATMLEVSGGKGSKGGARMDDFDVMMAEEEMGMGRGSKGGEVGSGIARGAAGNFGDMGY